MQNKKDAPPGSTATQIYKTIKDRADLIEFIKGTAEHMTVKKSGKTTIFNPCPMCGHNDCFTVSDKNTDLFKCHSCGVGGDIFTFAEQYRGLTKGKALHAVAEYCGIRIPALNADVRLQKAPRTVPESIADRCFDPEQTEKAVDYLVCERGLDEEIVRDAMKRKSLGFNVWTSPKLEPGTTGYGGPAVAFVVRSMNPGHIMAVDMRYVDPALNGGRKATCQGEKAGYPWINDLDKVKHAKTVYIVESSINALSVESCALPSTAAIATRGVANTIDWRFLEGKRVIICMDNDEPNEKTRYSAGHVASWKLYDALSGCNIAAHLVDQGDWKEVNDVNDILKNGGKERLKNELEKLSEWVIPGVRCDGKQKGKSRIYLPLLDSQEYWKYRAKEDFTSIIQRKTDKKTGDEIEANDNVCGFRIAGISRITIASVVSTMTGEPNNQTRTLFAAAAQSPRHGHKLVRKVFEDEKLHNVDQWAKFGSIHNRGAFLRLLDILGRGADLSAKHAVNFVGLAWRDGKPVINEGPDCYFTDASKQCPYADLTFPSGRPSHAISVIEAYHQTFKNNAALFLLTWALGGHLKAFLGFWPHMTLQADKGAGKSTLIKRLERTIGFTMFSGQSLQTEFRLLTSISHTSHPVGWEEISARRQDIIDKAVSLLQECYQYSISRRGSDMTEYLISAPVLLAGEDVPVKSLTGKLVRTDLTGRKGPLMPENLPRFPVREWLQYLAKLDPATVRMQFKNAEEYCETQSRAAGGDEGARRMITNYAAVLTAWKLLCDFAGLAQGAAEFVSDAVKAMNNHIAETSQDREPWVWILEILFSEIAAGNFKHPYGFDIDLHGELPRNPPDRPRYLFVRTSHVMHHLAHTNALRDAWNSLPVKSDRVFKRQLAAAKVIETRQQGATEGDDKYRFDKNINGHRVCNLVALDLEKLEKFGVR